MNKLNIKKSFIFWGTEFKEEKNIKIKDIDNVKRILPLEYEELLYMYEKINIYSYELRYKINDDESQYFNNYDYCVYLKNKYFKDNEEITDYILLNKMYDMNYSDFKDFVEKVKNNEN